MISKKITDLLSASLGQDKAVAAVIIYGSYAKNTEAPGSDLDIAVLYEHNQQPDFFDRQDLIDKLSGQLGVVVDLVVLNTASSILKRQILRYGNIVINNNPSALRQFMVRTQTEYFDLKRTRQCIETRMLANN